MYKKVLVGVDWSEASLKAVRKASELASKIGASLTLMTVIPPPTVFLGELLTPEVVDTSPLRKAAEERLARLSREVGEEYGVQADYVVVIGDPARELVSYATENGYDLIVLGKRRMSGIERFILGSVTKKVLENSLIDVLVVH